MVKSSKEDQTPKALAPYLFHGIDLQYNTGDSNAIADCPFCGRESKFSVNIDKGIYRCFTCGEGNEKGGGNAYVFLRKLWEMSYDNTTSGYAELQIERNLLNPDTLIHWGVCKSITTKDWVVPGYSVNGNLCQLYRYISDKGHRRLMATKGLSHQLWGVNLFDKKKPIIYLAEGVWDAMALWEVLSQVKTSDRGLVHTGNPEKSLLSQVNVLAAPGCNTFLESWLPIFENKIVVIMYDNDHERINPKTNKPVPPVGFSMVKRTTKILSSSENPPKSISWLKWSDKGFDPGLTSGFDVRDFITQPITSL